MLSFLSLCLIRRRALFILTSKLCFKFLEHIGGEKMISFNNVSKVYESAGQSVH
ncbi:phosphate ABC transporter ATP-binding protein, partial [Klebsiella pneumoniae]|nr:phosphate ABC transporter ATP-binding protein [Klebsiella pneumoniae]